MSQGRSLRACVQHNIIRLHVQVRENVCVSWCLGPYGFHVAYAFAHRFFILLWQAESIPRAVIRVVNCLTLRRGQNLLCELLGAVRGAACYNFSPTGG